MVFRIEIKFSPCRPCLIAPDKSGHPIRHFHPDPERAVAIFVDGGDTVGEPCKKAELSLTQAGDLAGLRADP